MTIVVDTNFAIGDTVYLKTDIEQNPRIVYAYMVYKNECLYKLACGKDSSDHYDFEISVEKNVLISIS